MNNLKRLMPDLLLVAGAVAVSYGVWTVYAPAGFVVVGVFAIIAGLQLAE